MVEQDSPIDSISAVTLVTTDMARSVRFYTALGFPIRYGGADAEFTTLAAGTGFVNIQFVADWIPPSQVWGRVIIWVDDVDAMYERALVAGGKPTTRPNDAPWGERYFHVHDPDGHELSFAAPIQD